MRIHNTFESLPTGTPRALTIGTFDGVHRGHRAILEALRAEAGRIGGESLIITFDPHPQEVLRKTGAGVPILTPIDQKLELFAQLGVDAVAVIPFTLEFAATPWKEFVDTLIAQAGMAAMVVGHDHAFGKGREGNAASLRAYGEERGYAVTEVPPLLVEGEAISSTVIRRALAAGDVEGAAAKLGRPYTIRGTVVPGDGRGRSIGIPTANIAPGHPDQLIPHDGVYVVRLRIADDHGTFSAPIGGMANIGVRPTFTDGERRTIEAHLFDFSDELYNRTVDLECRTLLRFEQKFPSKEAFLEQLARDRAASETALDLIRAAETPPTDRLRSSE